jgi:hypothetical protein
MSTGHRISATFSGGQIRQIMNSRRPYTHAWLAICTDSMGNSRTFSGFSMSEKQAEENAMMETRSVRHGHSFRHYSISRRPHRGATGKLKSLEIIRVETT